LRHFIKLGEGVDTRQVLVALHHNENLWNQNPIRKISAGSPHAEMDDIWVRYKDPKEVDINNRADMHFPVWLDAYYKLPQLRNIIFSVMAQCQAEHLGFVLITRIPPGCKVYPHKDAGWHPEFYNTKVYVALQTNDKCVNRVEEESVVMKTGDVWYWDNLKEHDVINDGDEDRITLIICLRTGG
jgi:hypothetical protein